MSINKRFCPKCRNMGIRAQNPKFFKNFKYSVFAIFSQTIHFQPALKQHPLINISRYIAKCRLNYRFGSKRPNMGGIQAQNPKILKKFKFSAFAIFSQKIHFQPALNQKFFCCHIQSNNTLPTSPQPTSYDKY